MPEVACAATAVSLLMPHVEPYVVRSVRSALSDLEDPRLQERTRAYLRQEGAHHAQHRRFNDAVCSRSGALGALDAWMARTYRYLDRRGPAFGLAYAAGFESVAFTAARWADRHHDELFAGAEPAAVDLFLWHLAEEVEHKDVAHEVFLASGGSRPRYLVGALVSLVLLGWFTLLGTLLLLASERRLWSPVAWFRLTRWSVGFAFEALPALVVTASPGHHPDQLADPPGLVAWLRRRDVVDDAEERGPGVDHGVGQLSPVTQP
jgi:predicted metal-dependent hydrolase